MKRIFIQIYNEYSLHKEMEVTHLPLNKLVPLMFADRFDYTRVTIITNDTEVLFKYNSRFDKTTTVQDLVDAYNEDYCDYHYFDVYGEFEGGK